MPEMAASPEAVLTNPAFMAQWLSKNPGGEKVVKRVETILDRWKEERTEIRSRSTTQGDSRDAEQEKNKSRGATTDVGRHAFSPEEWMARKAALKAISRELRDWDRDKAVERQQARSLVADLINAFRRQLREFRGAAEARSTDERNRQHINEVLDGADGSGAGQQAAGPAADPGPGSGTVPAPQGQQSQGELPPDLKAEIESERQSLLERIDGMTALTEAERTRAKRILAHDELKDLPVFERDPKLTLDVARYWGGRLRNQIEDVFRQVRHHVAAASAQLKQRLSSTEPEPEPESGPTPTPPTLTDLAERDQIDLDAAKQSMEGWLTTLPDRLSSGELNATSAYQEFTERIIGMPHELANDYFIQAFEGTTQAKARQAAPDLGHGNEEAAVVEAETSTGGRHRVPAADFPTEPLIPAAEQPAIVIDAGESADQVKAVADGRHRAPEPEGDLVDTPVAGLGEAVLATPSGSGRHHLPEPEDSAAPIPEQAVEPAVATAGVA